MSRRDDLIDLFSLGERAFAERVVAFLARDGLDTERRIEVADAGPEAFAGPDELADFDDLTPRERDLVWRAWLLDEVPFGLTVSGPAYQDNPIVYANQTLRRMTGYTLSDLRDENPRILQGPETEPEAVDTLREALDIWEPVTVDLRNYRKDGSPFVNRVSLVPLSDETGTVSNWVGVQAVVEESG